MAIAGAKPKATNLHVVQGTFRGDRHERAGEPTPVGTIEKPSGLRGKPGALWDRFIARAFWLTWADSPKALMWCHLQAEFEKSPTGMVASRIGQLRALGSELGLDPSARARLGGKADDKPKDAAGKYFE